MISDANVLSMANIFKADLAMKLVTIQRDYGQLNKRDARQSTPDKLLKA